MNSASSFNCFYQTWLHQLHLLTSQLSLHVDANKDADGECAARRVVDEAMTLYSELYGAARGDVLAQFAAPWDTSLERSLHWVAGFRPTIVFHLIYTVSSARFESQLLSFLRGHRTGDLGELTAEQLNCLSDLQGYTVREEDQISSRVSAWQEELVGMDWAAGGDAFQGRVDRLRDVVGSANHLRLRTLSDVVGLLSTRQAAEFLLAFTHLLLGFALWECNWIADFLQPLKIYSIK